MSTILDALEKASRKSGGGPGASAGPSLRERQLEEEVERGRRMTILAAAGLLLVGLGAIASMMLFTRRAPAPVSPPRAAGSRVDAARPTPAAELPVVAATPPPSPVPTATPAPTPTPDAPARTPEPTPTPRPPMATTTAAALRPYLKDGQLITAADLGWKIEGVMELGDTSFAMIDGDQVQTGTVYRGYHLVGVSTGLLTFDLGDGRIVKVAY